MNKWQVINRQINGLRNMMLNTMGNTPGITNEEIKKFRECISFCRRMKNKMEVLHEQSDH